jgi:6,7-dimethyl-8-ribityllumazine synthase
MRDGARLAIVAAEFNRAIVDAMVATASDEVEKVGARIVREVRVAGCYETVLVADALLTRSDVDAVVVLGFIERGETLHGEVMGHVVLGELVELELKHRKPIGIGVIGPGATEEQAHQRKDATARSAVRAPVRSLAILEPLGRRGSE